MTQTADPNTEFELTAEWIDDFMERWQTAWETSDVEGVLALLTEDIEYRDAAWHKTMHGLADVREFVETWVTATPDMKFEMLTGPYPIPGESRVAVHWRSWGTFTGPVNPPGFKPNGRRWDFEGVDMHEYRDGRICKLRVIYDMVTPLRQLGVMPPPESRKERLLVLAQNVLAWGQSKGDTSWLRPS